MSASQGASHPPPGPNVAAPTVLLVDAHEDSRLIYAACLRHHGIAVVAHECFSAAVETARLEQPQVIVLALSFASGPGWTALRALKEDPATAAIPVLAVSTTGLAEHRERAFALGCAAFFVKPLPPLDLLNAALGLVEGTRGAAVA
jgi:CheY-like chemotaxis protein